jgi:hypothetical protein
MNLAQSIGDPRLGDVVRRHFHTDTVAGCETDKMFTHFAGYMCQNLMLVVKHDPKHGSGQNSLDCPFQFYWLFGAHKIKKNVLNLKIGFGRNAFNASADERSLGGLSGIITARTSVATAATAAAAFFARARFIDGEFAAVQFLVGGAFNGGLGSVLGRHGDKSETTGPSGGAISDQIDFIDWPESGKHVLQIVLGRIKRQIPNI